jgi:hypothetical protein
MTEKRVWEKRIVELTPADYELLQTKAKEFDLLAEWLHENMNHQIGVTGSEGAREMVQRILMPFVEPALIGYVSFIATDDEESEVANVVCDGRLWNMNGVATQAMTVDEALDRLKDVFSLYEMEIAKKWGPRVLVEKTEYARIQERMAEEIDNLRAFLGRDENVVSVVPGVRGFVVYLKDLGMRIDGTSAEVLGMTHWCAIPITYERAEE